MSGYVCVCVCERITCATSKPKERGGLAPHIERDAAAKRSTGVRIVASSFILILI